jgi:hypothetical protein
MLLALAGLALCTASVVAFVWSLYSVARIGTCASGGPYVSARPCPPGTGGKIVLLTGSVFAGLLGIALYSAGRRAASAAIGLGTLMWSFLFLGAAAAVSLAAFGPAAPEDAGSGAKIAAITLLVVFVPMGLFPLVGALVMGRRHARGGAGAPGEPLRPARGGPSRPAPRASEPVRLEGVPGSGDEDGGLSGIPGAGEPPPAPPPAPAGPGAAGGAAGDQLDRLERLARLREQGLIDAAEYERLKDRLLGSAG